MFVIQPKLLLVIDRVKKARRWFCYKQNGKKIMFMKRNGKKIMLMKQNGKKIMFVKWNGKGGLI